MNLDLRPLPYLSSGKHQEGSHKLCAMELIAYMERLPHSDHPPCTCNVLAAYTLILNDSMDDRSRQSLLPVLPLLVGTVSPEHEG